MINATIRFEQIDETSFPGLKKLVLEQARHHHSDYTGDDQKFIAALEREDPVPFVMMARDDATQEPVGYILFSRYHGLGGSGLYIEDILVSSRLRSQGLGLTMIEKLKTHARELDMSGVSWMVAKDNPNAIRFYEKKAAAKPLPYDVYECGDLFNDPPAQGGYEVRTADAGDLDLLESYVGRIDGLTAERMANIRAAAEAHNTNVYIALDGAGSPQALGITNDSYSTFRTVYGYKLELMGLTNDAAAAFNALAAHVAETGVKTGRDGHLNICINRDSAVQNAFMRKLAFPESDFLLYGIGHEKISAPQQDNAPKAQGPHRKFAA